MGRAVVAVADARVVRIGRSARLGRYVRLRDVFGNTYTYGGLSRLERRFPVLRPAPRGTAAPMPAKVEQDPRRHPRRRAAGAQPAAARGASRAGHAARAAAAPARRRGRAAPAAARGQPRRQPQAGPRRQPRGQPRRHPPAEPRRPPRAAAAARPRAPAPRPAAAARRRAAGAARLGRAGPPHGHRAAAAAAAGAPRPRAAAAKPATTAACSATSPPRASHTGRCARARASSPARSSGAPSARPAGRRACASRSRPPAAARPASTPRRSSPDGSCCRPRRRARRRSAAPRQPSIGQVMLLGKQALERLVLANPRIAIYPCGREDIRAGRVDRRVLATLQLLAMSGLSPTVSSLQCGHSRLTASGNVSEHWSGNAVDISAINGTPILGNQGAGSIADTGDPPPAHAPGRDAPHQIISLMTYAEAANTHGARRPCRPHPRRLRPAAGARLARGPAVRRRARPEGVAAPHRPPRGDRQPARRHAPSAAALLAAPRRP